MSFTNFPLSGASLLGICSDGTDLWAADVALNGVWKITTAGSGTFYGLTGAMVSGGICYGPDGNLWLTDAPGGVWRVTTSGVGTKYTLGSGLTLGNICVGSDGNLWVSGEADNIWQVTTAGSGTDYPYGSGGVQWQDICSGPDGNLWGGVEYGPSGPPNSAIWNMTTSGTPTLFTCSAQYNFEDICSAAGDLYLSGSSGIVQCTTAGSSSVYSSSSFGIVLNGICYDGYSIQSVGTYTGGQGILYSATIPGATLTTDNQTSAHFVDVCLGPDGQLWITDLTTGNGVWTHAASVRPSANAIVMLV